jgi:hypothetical protein
LGLNLHRQRSEKNPEYQKDIRDDHYQWILYYKQPATDVSIPDSKMSHELLSHQNDNRDGRYPVIYLLRDGFNYIAHGPLGLVIQT